EGLGRIGVLLEAAVGQAGVEDPDARIPLEEQARLAKQNRFGANEGRVVEVVAVVGKVEAAEGRDEAAQRRIAIAVASAHVEQRDLQRVDIKIVGERSPLRRIDQHVLVNRLVEKELRLQRQLPAIDLLHDAAVEHALDGKRRL